MEFVQCHADDYYYKDLCIPLSLNTLIALTIRYHIDGMVLVGRLSFSHIMLIYTKIVVTMYNGL